jgi:hypothetical protein
VAKKSDGDGTRDVHGIRVGKPDTRPDAPSHTRGAEEGNHPKRQNKLDDASRSTGIRTAAHDPIDPKMPKISPA